MTNNKIKVIYSNTIFNYEPLKSIKLPQNIYNQTLITFSFILKKKAIEIQIRFIYYFFFFPLVNSIKGITRQEI